MKEVMNTTRLKFKPAIWWRLFWISYVLCVWCVTLLNFLLGTCAVCMCMCVCVYACVCARMWMCARVCACARACVCVWERCMHMCVCGVCACVCVCLSVSVCVCVCLYVCLWCLFQWVHVHATEGDWLFLCIYKLFLVNCSAIVKQFCCWNMIFEQLIDSRGF